MSRSADISLNELLHASSDRTGPHRSDCDDIGPDGLWREACPLPFYLSFGRCLCSCGRKFWSEAKYNVHWREENDKLMWWNNL